MDVISDSNVGSLTESELSRMNAAQLESVLSILGKIQRDTGKLSAEQSRVAAAALKYRENLKGANGELEKSNSTLSKIGTVLSSLRMMGMTIINTAKELAEPFGKIDQAAHEFGRTIGGNTASMKRLAQETLEFGRTSFIGSKYNTDVVEMIKLQESYSKSVGRNLQLTNQQKETLLATSKVMGDKAIDFNKKLENMGIGLERSGDLAAKMFNEASKSGISFEKYSANVTENLTKVQSYGFKNGVEGLTAMAKQAAEVNLNMGEAFKVAEKIQSGGIQSTIKMGAGLQVLGGSFSQFGDPMGMLYQGLNDVGSLQDRLVDMFGNLGQLKNGQVNFSAANRLRMRAAAESLGVSADEMMQMASRKAIRGRLEGELKGKGYSKEIEEYLLNTATLDENNRGEISIAGKKRSISDLGEEDLKYLEKQMMPDSDKITDIAQNVQGFMDVQSGLYKQIEIEKAGMLSGFTGFLNNIYKTLGTHTGLLKAMAIASIASSVIGAAGSLVRGGGNIARAFRGGKGAVNAVRGTRAATTAVRGGTALAKGGTSALRAGTAIQSSTGAIYTIGKGGKLLNSSGKVISGAARNSVLRSAQIASNTGKAASAVGKAATSVGKIASKAGGALAGGAFAALEYAMDGSWKGDRSQKNKAIGGTIGATIGGLASFIPVIGPVAGIAGAMAGQWIGEKIGGAITKRQDKKRKEARDVGLAELGKDSDEGKAFEALKGDYSSKELKKIKEALKDGTIGKGELSKSLMKKLQKNGDAELIEQFGDDETKEKFKKAIGKMSAKIDKGEMSIENASVTFANANFTGQEVPTFGTGGKIEGVSHEQGGVIVNAEGGEYIVAKEAVSKNERALDFINQGGVINDETIVQSASERLKEKSRIKNSGKISNILPSLVKNPMMPLPVKAAAAAAGLVKNKLTDKLEVSPIKLDVSGTIKLDADGKTVDLDAIVNNPAFLTQLSQMIERRLSDNVNGGNFKELRKNKRHTF